MERLIIKLEATDMFVMWLNSLTSTELKNAFPNIWETVQVGNSNDENTIILLNNDRVLWELTKSHMQLINSDLEERMIYPLDKDGNRLTEPSMYKDYCNEVLMSSEDNLLCIEYQEAIKKVLFNIDPLEDHVELLLGQEYKVKYMIGKVNVELNQMGINYLTRGL